MSTTTFKSLLPSHTQLGGTWDFCKGGWGSGTCICQRYSINVKAHPSHSDNACYTTDESHAKGDDGANYQGEY